MNLEAALNIIDLLLAFNILMEERSDIASEFAAGRDRVVELYLTSKDRPLTEQEEAEIKDIRDSIKEAREQAVQSY